MLIVQGGMGQLTVMLYKHNGSKNPEEMLVDLLAAGKFLAVFLA